MKLLIRNGCSGFEPFTWFNCLRTIQRCGGHLTQSDWPLCGGTCMLNLDDSLSLIVQGQRREIASFC